MPPRLIRRTLRAAMARAAPWAILAGRWRVRAARLRPAFLATAWPNVLALAQHYGAVTRARLIPVGA